MSEVKRIYRSRDQRVITGTLGGLAEYLGVSAWPLRIVYIGLMLITGFWTGLVVYIVAAVIIPQRPIATVSASGEPVIVPPAPPVPPASPASQPPVPGA